MPTLTRLCNKPACNAAATYRSSYCAAHKAESEAKAARFKNMSGGQRRQSAHRQGYDTQWEKVRRMHMRRQPLCVKCGAMGEHVDHIVPFDNNPALRLDFTNLQTLCKRCHGRKSAHENRGEGGRFRTKGRVSTPVDTGGGRGRAILAQGAGGNGEGGQKFTPSGFGGRGMARPEGCDG